MNNLFIDTNIFLRLFTGDDPKMLTECMVFLDKIKKEKLKVFTSATVLSEVVWTLESFYKFPKSSVVIGIRSIIGIPNLEILDEYMFLHALETYNDSSVKFIDALIASNSEIQSKKMTVVSYDKDFDKLGVKRLEPKDLL